MDSHCKIGTISLILGCTLLSGCSQIATWCGGFHVRTQIDIKASPDTIFTVLTDFDAYPTWNPYHQRISGNVALGASVDLLIVRPDKERVELTATITQLEHQQSLFWGGGIPGIFTGEHRFILTPIDQHYTRLHHDEDFSGCIVPLVNLPKEVIEQGYMQMNMALKHHIESSDFQRSTP